MARFSKQSARPMTAEHYRRAARKAAKLATAIEHSAVLETRGDPLLEHCRKASLTRAIHDLAMHAKRLSDRHRETP